MSESAIPLPEGVADATLNRGQLARALGVSEPTVDRWITEGMPVLEAGANGKAYKFLLSDCWNWRQQREGDEARRSEDAERSVRQMRLALIGGEVGDSERGLSPKERTAIYEAEAAWMAAARERGELVPAKAVTELLENVFGIIRDAVNALPDRLARECNLGGRHIERVIVAGDDMLDEARRRIASVHLGAAV